MVLNCSSFKIDFSCFCRSQHEKAVQYFQRALKLNPNYLAAWTLMGHEFMELKNTNAAIDCYRKAISNYFYCALKILAKNGL